MGWVCWLTYGTYVALITSVGAVIARGLYNPRLTHQAQSLQPLSNTKLQGSGSMLPSPYKDCATAVHCMGSGPMVLPGLLFLFFFHFIQVSIHLHASAHAHTHTHAPPPPLEKLSSLYQTTALLLAPAACYNMKSDTVNLPPNLSEWIGFRWQCCGARGL